MNSLYEVSLQALIFWVTDNFLMVKVKRITRGDDISRDSSSSGISRVYSKVSMDSVKIMSNK